MDFTQAKQTVLSELQGVFDTVDEKQVVELTEMICSAEKVFVVGVG